jgi:menaquinone-dependent protoporphyrinogen oxidase
MKVLVCAASRHGATTEVAATIAAALTAAGHEGFAVAPSEVGGVDGYDAAVIGSAVYAGRWLDPAKDLLERNRAGLAKVPVWLFSSGPVGDPPKPAEDPIDAPLMTALIGARDHRLFPGRIDRKRLGFGERAILAAVRAAEGDFRPWPEIDAWATEIATELEGAKERATEPAAAH